MVQGTNHIIMAVQAKYCEEQKVCLRERETERGRHSERSTKETKKQAYNLKPTKYFQKRESNQSEHEESSGWVGNITCTTAGIVDIVPRVGSPSLFSACPPLTQLPCKQTPTPTSRFSFTTVIGGKWRGCVKSVQNTRSVWKTGMDARSGQAQKYGLCPWLNLKSRPTVRGGGGHDGDGWLIPILVTHNSFFFLSPLYVCTPYPTSFIYMPYQRSGRQVRALMFLLLASPLLPCFFFFFPPLLFLLLRGTITRNGDKSSREKHQNAMYKNLALKKQSPARLLVKCDRVYCLPCIPVVMPPLFRIKLITLATS